jgi:Flp pilus assembly secretin CpaC
MTYGNTLLLKGMDAVMGGVPIGRGSAGLVQTSLTLFVQASLGMSIDRGIWAMRSARKTGSGATTGSWSAEARQASSRPRQARLSSALVLALSLLALPCSTLARAEETPVTVLLDRAQVLAYPPDTETVIVGNPIIADVTMLKNTGQVILTGKGFGDTNLLFLNGHGAVVGDVRLRVREAPSVMVVQRGMDRETYACHPRCEPTVSLGDSSTFLQRSMSDLQSRNSQATGAASTASSAQPH